MDLYFEWLLEQVDCPENYRKLMDKLYSRPFTFSIKRDENRVGDGLALRDRFADEYGDVRYEDIPHGECSVLEVLIALACRMEDDILHDPELGDRSPEWFWMMITNLRLDRMDDEHFDAHNVDDILNVFLNRTYFMNGTGGLFPLKLPKVNQRRVEIWYQMSAFIDENFD